MCETDVAIDPTKYGASDTAAINLRRKACGLSSGTKAELFVLFPCKTSPPPNIAFGFRGTERAELELDGERLYLGVGKQLQGLGSISFG